MSPPKRPPPGLLLETCSAIDDGLAEIAVSLRDLPASQWEAPLEARHLVLLVFRSVEAILTLAREDMVLLPAAQVIARTALETSVRARWLVQPPEDFAREARWLEHLAEEERLWERLATMAGDTGGNVADHKAIAQQYYAFRSSVEAKLPAGFAMRIPVIVNS